MEYAEFLAAKVPQMPPAGIDVEEGELHATLFPFQRRATAWALRKGRAAIFAGCGMGKTAMQLEWCHQLISRGIVDRALIVCPLNVSRQTIREGSELLGVEVHDLRADEKVRPVGIHIVNYERLDKIDADDFGAVVLDESSILKAFRGATRDRIIETFAGTRYKLACTATPAPNDHIELQSHAMFLEAPGATEMRARWFCVDWDAGVGDQKYRLKGHASPTGTGGRCDTVTPSS